MEEEEEEDTLKHCFFFFFKDVHFSCEVLILSRKQVCVSVLSLYLDKICKVLFSSVCLLFLLSYFRLRARHLFFVQLLVYRKTHIDLIFLFLVPNAVSKEHSLGDSSLKCPFYLKLFHAACVCFCKRADGSNVFFDQRESPEFLHHHSWQPHIYINGWGRMFNTNEQMFRCNHHHVPFKQTVPLKAHDGQNNQR